MNLHGLSFLVRATASVGVVSVQTRLHLIQRGSRIFGRYAGGSIVRGRLVGQVSGHDLTFRYAQREREGVFTGPLELRPGGSARRPPAHTRTLHLETREGAGTNVFEQVSDGVA